MCGPSLRIFARIRRGEATSRTQERDPRERDAQMTPWGTGRCHDAVGRASNQKTRLDDLSKLGRERQNTCG